MSNLIRWEPAREMMTLREAMDRLFDDAFTTPLSLRDGWSMATPAIDMYQTDNEVSSLSLDGRCPLSVRRCITWWKKLPITV